MKSFILFVLLRSLIVALYMGAWIEILIGITLPKTTSVALYMGAWIEIIDFVVILPKALPSHSIWVRGLKFFIFDLF